MEKKPILTVLGLNLESHGGNNLFMIRHMVGGAKHSGVKRRGAKPTFYEDKVDHVTRSKVVTIAVPSCLMEWFVLEPYVGNEDLVAHTEVQEPRPILIAFTNAIFTNAMKTNH